MKYITAEEYWADPNRGAKDKTCKWCWRPIRQYTISPGYPEGYCSWCGDQTVVRTQLPS